MKKTEFLSALRRLLAGLEATERDASLEYYGELIDDRREEGLDEAAAVASVGTPEAAAQAILKEVPFSRLIKARVKPRRHPAAWEIVLLVLGFPLWFSLLVAALAVVISLYVSLWAIMISFWAADVALGAGALAAFGLTVPWMLGKSVGVGILMIGTALLLSGLAVAAFLGCLALTRLLCAGSQKAVVGVKMLLVGKEKEVIV